MPIHDIEIEKKALAKEYKELLMISYQSLSKDDKKLIRKRWWNDYPRPRIILTFNLLLRGTSCLSLNCSGSFEFRAL